MKAKKKLLLLGVAAMLGIGVASITLEPAVTVEAADVDVPTVQVVNQKVWGGNYGVVGLKFTPDGLSGNWTGNWYGGASATPGSAVALMYDLYGTATEMKSWYPAEGLLFTSYNDINRYGNILSIPEGFTLTASATGDTYHFAEQMWICKLANGEVGDWEPFVAPTTFEFTAETTEVTVGSELDLSTLINIVTEDDDPIITYKVDGTGASVDANGMLTGSAVGTVTVTAYSGLKTDTITVNVTAGDVAQTGIELNLDSVEAYQYLTADISDLKYAPVFEDGSKGALVAVPADAIATYNTDEVGTKQITVTIDGFTDTFDLVVKEMETAMDFVRPITGSLATAGAWGRNFMVQIVDNPTTTNGAFSAEATANAERFIKVNDGTVSIKNITMLSSSLSFGLVDKTGWVAGDVITLKAGLYSWTNANLGNQADFEPIAVLKEDVHLFYNGTQFVESVGGITDFDVIWDYTAIQVGETLAPSYSFEPDTTGERPTFVSSEPEVLAVTETGAVTGLKEGTATVTATIGDLSKNYEFTVIPAKTVTGVEPANSAYTHRVYVGQDLTEWEPTISDFILVYEDGTKSNPLPSTNFTYTVDNTFAHDTAGMTETTVNVTYKEAAYTCKLPIDVRALIDEQISGVNIVSGFTYWMHIKFETTCFNPANITNGANSAQMDFLSYKRADGTDVPIRTVWQLQSAVYLEPSFLPTGDSTEVVDGENYNSTKYYLPGDTLTIRKGMPIYCYNGTLTGQTMVEGEVILEGYYNGDDLTYRFNGEAWSFYKESTGITAEETEITIDVGQRVLSNVNRVPADATTGELTYVSSDENIATVSASGIITGVGPGECTITATLKIDEETSYTVEIKVTVNDSITGVAVTNVDADNPLTVTKGNDLDLSKLEGNMVYASGKAGDPVDFSTARVVSGFDKNTVGDQIVTISITVDGKEYRLNINVRVVEEGTTPGGETSTPTESTPTGSTPTGDTGEGGGLTPAAIGGIVGGCVGGVVVIGGIVWLIIWLRKKH